VSQVQDAPASAIKSEEDIVALFSRYTAVAILANSMALDLDAVQRELPANTLFVVFTYCNKILTSSFRRDTVIVHRMRDHRFAMNSNEVLRRSRELIDPAYLKSEIGLFVSLETDTSAQPRHDRDAVSFPVIDADAYFSSFYTRQHRPSSGFGLALWLAERLNGIPIVLCGFTGVRDGSLKMSSMHDWTLEQTLLRILYREGKLVRFEDSKETLGSVTRIAKAFPAFREEDIAAAALEVLNERTQGLDTLTATLLSVWRPILRANEKLKRRPPGNKF